MRWLPLLLALGALGCEKDSPNTLPPPISSTLPPPPPGPEAGADPEQRHRATLADARIAFARGTELWTMKADGTDATRLLKVDGDVATPAWSPNRKWIAFSSNAGADRNLHRRNLFIVRPDGTSLRQVTPLPRSGQDLENAPKGIVRGRAVLLVETGRLGANDFDVAIYGRNSTEKTGAGGLFETYAPMGTTWIKISGTHNGMRYSGMVLQPVREGRITELSSDVILSEWGADFETCSPSWSADGRFLYYLLRAPAPRRPGMSRASTLHRIGLDGTGGDTIFTDAGGPIEAMAVSGARALCKARDGRLVTVDVTSRQPVGENQLVGVATPDALAIAGDGRIALTRMDEQLRSLLVVRNGTSEETVWMGTPNGRIFALDFSPDGGSIVFDLRSKDASNIHVVNLASKQVKALTNDGSSSDPAWYGR